MLANCPKYRPQLVSLSLIHFAMVSDGGFISSFLSLQLAKFIKRNLTPHREQNKKP